MRAVAIGLLLCACVHATPRATTLGKKVGLGEVRALADTKALIEDALRERFELVGDETAELHLHVDATLSGFDQPLSTGAISDPRAGALTRLYRRVETLRATVRLVRDATGEELAVGIYELSETGPERPMGTTGADELGTILARRLVRTFIEEKKL